MMFLRSIMLLALFSSAAAHNSDTVDGDIMFTREYRDSGVTYVDTMDMDQISHMEISQQKLDQVLSIHVASETAVSDILDTGGKALDVKLTHFAMDTEMMGMKTSFDSADPDAAAEADTQIILDMIGTSQHIELDEEGNIVQDEQDTTVTTTDANAKLSPTQQFDQMSRLLQLIPGHPVSVGDEWDANIDMGDVGHFAGVATFRGHKSVEGYDCAEITTEGTLDMDMEKVANMMGGGLASDLLSNIEVRDGIMKTTMFWDNDAKIARWTKSTTTMTMVMDSPLGDGTKMIIPLEQTMKMTTSIK